MVLDLLDKKILSALNLNARASYSELARLVSSSKEVVNYRVNKLINEGIIKNFITVFWLGYWSYKVVVKTKKVKKEDEAKIIIYLKGHNNVNWVTLGIGSGDFIFSIMAKDPSQFEIILHDILNKLSNYIYKYQFSIGIDSETFGYRYASQPLKEEGYANPKMRWIFEFDGKDKKIAEILKEDARAKIKDISKKTKLPVDTIKYRIKRMETNGIIRRYRAIIDPSKLGYNRYELFIKCQNLSKNNLNSFKQYAQQNLNIEFFENCVGSWDIELTACFKNNLEFRSFVAELKESFGDIIIEIESMNLFETYNYSYVTN